MRLSLIAQMNNRSPEAVGGCANLGMTMRMAYT